MKKRILSAALILLMALTLLPTAALGAAELEVNWFTLPENTELVTNGTDWRIADAELGPDSGRFLTQTRVNENSFNPEYTLTVIDRRGTPLATLPGTYQNVDIWANGMIYARHVTGDLKEIYRLFNNRGEEVLSSPCQGAWLNDSPDGFSYISIDGENGTCGLMDTAGNWILPMGNYSSVSVDDPAPYICIEQNGAKYWIDRKGNWVSSAEPVVPKADGARYPVTSVSYRELRPLSEGMAAFNQDGRWGFLDETGKVAISPSYDWVQNFQNGMAVAGVNLGPSRDPLRVVSLIDKTGAAAPLPANTREITHILGHWYIVYAGGRENLALVKPGWAQLMEGDYSSRDIGQCLALSDSVLAAHRPDEDHHWGVYDLYDMNTGARLMTGLENVETAKDGRIRISLDGKVGFLDAAGKTVIPCIYGDAGIFAGNLTWVADSKFSPNYQILDRAGSVIYNLSSDSMLQFCSLEVTPEGKYLLLEKSTVTSALSADPGRITRSCAIVENPYYVPEMVLTIPAVGTAYPSTQSVQVDGRDVEFQMYALKDEAGNPTNYIRVRDLAQLLSGTAAQFNVGWTTSVNLEPGVKYAPAAGDGPVPFSGERPYTAYGQVTYVDGRARALTAFQLTDDSGGGYTYYQLRDLGRTLGFNVGWSPETGIFLRTDQPYSEKD